MLRKEVHRIMTGLTMRYRFPEEGNGDADLEE